MAILTTHDPSSQRGTPHSADMPFPSYAFPGAFFPTERNMPDRIRDIFNVKEFGAKGDNISGAGGTDDRAAIQDAMQHAANNGGGVVFFPRGNYYVGSKLIPPGDSTYNQGYGIHLLGSGGDASSAGSRVWTDQRDYVLYVGHGPAGGAGHQIPNPIRSICHLNFQNSYGGANEAAYLAAADMTTTEPKATTGYVDGTPGPSGKEGHGGVYLGNVYRGTFINMNISFGTGIGICVASGYGMEFVNCDVHGGFNPDSTNPAMFSNFYKSIGIWHRAGGIRGARMDNMGTGIIITDGPAQIENIDIENSGNGIICGAKPLVNWNPELMKIRPVDDQARFQLSHIRSLGCEKIVNIGYWIKTGGNAVFNSLHMAGGGMGAVGCKYGIKVDGGSNMLFQGIMVEGYIEKAAVDIRGATGCTFRNVAPSVAMGGGAPWILRTDWTAAGSSAYGNVIEFCDATDGGVLRSQLPPGAAGRMYNHTVVCTDSVDLAYSGGVSNIGKTITGGGMHKVLARWNGAAWVIAG